MIQVILLRRSRIESSLVLPHSMLVTYRDVQNMTSAHFTKLSRKHINVIRSVEIWMKYLPEEKQYFAEYVQHSGKGAPFLIYWMSSWQLNVGYLQICLHRYCN
ncbi:hypothetical protein BD770DRAFT_151438 [Pilaira anomala]|nr:hypothetical protein BD770DRAFT_151438 [Pilaira anomala]